MSQMMNEVKPGNEEQVDTVLRHFFQAEMPHPWPRCEASAQARLFSSPRRFRAVGRMALAAAVVLFFVGYFTVSGFFPPTQNSPRVGGPEMGKNPLKSHVIAPKK